MAYSQEKLVELLAEMVRQQPSLTEAEASGRLHVHRHTLERALKACGCTFAALKRVVVFARLQRHFASSEPTSLKQVWTELGFSSASAFARYIRKAAGKSPKEFRDECILGHSARKRAEVSLDVEKGGGAKSSAWQPALYPLPEAHLAAE